MNDNMPPLNPNSLRISFIVLELQTKTEFACYPFQKIRAPYESLRKGIQVAWIVILVKAPGALNG